MHQQIKNILLPTDFSDAGNNATKAAATLCQQNHAVLHLLHVLETTVYESPGEKPSGNLSVNDLEARELLYNVYETLIRDYRISVQIYMPTGIVAMEICRLTAEIGFDLVVLGTCLPLTATKLNAFGTMQHIIEHIQTPLLIIPIKFNADSFQKILFPVRAVNDLKEKFNFLKPFLKRSCHVYITALCLEGDEKKLLPYRHDFHEIVLSLNDLGVSCSKELYICDNLAQKVVDISTNVHADLVVINPTNERNAEERLIKDYICQVVNCSSIPVLIFAIKKALTISAATF